MKIIKRIQTSLIHRIDRILRDTIANNLPDLDNVVASSIQGIDWGDHIDFHQLAQHIELEYSDLARHVDIDTIDLAEELAHRIKLEVKLS